jgi:hypothetical protein
VHIVWANFLAIDMADTRIVSFGHGPTLDF